MEHKGFMDNVNIAMFIFWAILIMTVLSIIE